MTNTVGRSDTSGTSQAAPRRISANPGLSDRVFVGVVRGVAALVLVITGAIGVFLAYQGVPTFKRYGLSFFSGSVYDPNTNQVGISSAMLGTVVIAVLALLIAFPFALATALYISEYAPTWSKSSLTSLLDLMAAIPSVIVGAFGYFVLMPQMLWVARWISTWFGWIPVFDVPGADPRAAQLAKFRFQQSPFICATVVAIMVVPLAAAVMMNVFGQAPVGEREAAYALGATRWGMIRSVVLPFGRGGIIGGTMLGLGRALGETIAVLFIISESFQLKVHVLANGGMTISRLIGDKFGDSSKSQLAALLAAGFVLFLMTLAVNTSAAVVVARGRSGAGVDL